MDHLDAYIIPKICWTLVQV